MTVFRPIPEYVPPTVGLWAKDAAWQESDARKKGARRIKTARRQRLMACNFALRCLPAFESRYPDYRRPRAAIEVAERFADGLATREELRAACYEAYSSASWAANSAAYWAASWAANSAAYSAAYWAANSAAYSAANSAAERLNQSRIYTLFLPMAFDESWRTSAIIALAGQFYAGDTTVGPIIADCIEEVGYDGPDYWLRLLREDAWVLSKGMVLIDAIIASPAR